VSATATATTSSPEGIVTDKMRKAVKGDFNFLDTTASCRRDNLRSNRARVGSVDRRCGGVGSGGSTRAGHPSLTFRIAASAMSQSDKSYSR
jgi:hypothetical protein